MPHHSRPEHKSRYLSDQSGKLNYLQLDTGVTVRIKDLVTITVPYTLCTTELERADHINISCIRIQKNCLSVDVVQSHHTGT
jgi:hypothetical protein